MNTVCKSCKYWGVVGWNKNIKVDEGMGCQKAPEKSSNDGYGPWKDGVACINDADFELPKNLFAPVDEQAFNAERKRVEELRDKLYMAKQTIEKLEKNISKLGGEL